MEDTKTRTLEKFEACGNFKLQQNIKHSPTPSQMNLKLHTEDFLPQYLLLYISSVAFNKNYKTYWKAIQNVVRIDKVSIRTRLRYDIAFGMMRQTI